MDIFKNKGAGEETSTDTQQAHMQKAAEERKVSDKAEEEGAWVQPDEVELGNDDLRTTRSMSVKHGMAKSTRATQREKNFWPQ